MHPLSRNYLILLLIFSLALIAGCSGSDPEPPAEPSAEPEAAALPDDAIDLILQGAFVVTMDEAGTVIPNGAVAVDDGAIIAVGKTDAITSEYTARQTLYGEDRIVMPGLVNGHQHAAMTLVRGIADDRALIDWLENYIFPTEVEFVDEEFVRVGTEVSCWEMIRGGTTTFVDMYYYPDTIAQVVDECGMRALISATVIDQRSPDAENAQDSIAKGMQFADRWQGKNSRITPIFGPHANYTVNADQLRATREEESECGVEVAIASRLALETLA